MGSGSSSEAPKETQSAPVTARTTPKQPKRNRQFEEVQLAGQGGQGGQGGSRQRQPARSTGASPNPHQSATTATSKNTRGTDPGASGGTTDRSKQQNTPRQGAAANGRKDGGTKSEEDMSSKQPPTQAKTSSQQDARTATFQEVLDKLKKPDVNKRIQTIKEEEVDIVTNGQASGSPAVKDIDAPSGTSQPSNRNQVNVSHGNKFQTNQVKARESAQAKFQTDHAKARESAQAKFQTEKTKQAKITSSVAETEHTGNKGVTDTQRDMNKTGKANTEKKGSNEASKDSRNLGKGQNQSVGGQTEKIPSTVNTAVMNGDLDNEDLEDDLDDLSYDHGEESDFSDEQDQEHEELDDDLEDQYRNETAQVTAASGERNMNQAGARNNDRAETTVSMKDDDIVFETFYHRSGKEFQCIYQSGMRFYLDDWGSKEWQPFPKRWYNEGLLVTNTILKDENAEQNRGEQAAGASGQGQSSRSQGRGQGQSQGGSGGGDDREGFLMHPTKGRIPTYIFYKKHNVHMYFDRDTGSWVRMPIGWELHHNMVKSLVDQVEEAVPTWGDRHDILALLRACNYDPDECISIYLHLEKDEWMKGPKTSKENKVLMEKEARVLELEKRVRHLEIQLQKEIDVRQDAERNLEIQMTKFSELEAESKDTEAQLSAVTGGRPPTARPFSRMVKPGQKGAKGAVVGAVVKGGSKQVQSGENVNPDDVIDLSANAKELRKAHTRVKMDVERFMGDMKNMLGKIGPAFKQMKQSEKGTQNEIEEVRALYRKEALQRRLLYNQLQELRGNIRVFCRVRKDDRAENCLKYPSDQDLIATSQGQKKMFNFDKVFDPSSTQEAVFEDTKPIITSCADGYNVCLLAYGQTGSGKTFTMMGPDSNPGINIRAMKELFQVCIERKETMTYKLTVSLVEIYNETIQDLLTSDAKTLELRTAGNKVQIPGLIEHEIKNLDDVKKVMSLGDKNRSVASTKMNSTSSRSHLVLMLAVEGHDKVTSAITRGTLVLCDLAGSERISKTEAEGQRLVEAAAINKSLSALGQVFSALRSSQLHVPYRNSKLTQILQPSLGGDAKACLFVNVSPDSYNFAETVSTLSFGSNARQVALGQAKQNITKGKG